MHLARITVSLSWVLRWMIILSIVCKLKVPKLKRLVTCKIIAMIPDLPQQRSTKTSICGWISWKHIMMQFRRFIVFRASVDRFKHRVFGTCLTLFPLAELLVHTVTRQKLLSVLYFIQAKSNKGFGKLLLLPMSNAFVIFCDLIKTKNKYREKLTTGKIDLHFFWIWRFECGNHVEKMERQAFHA